ncbi:hypothetical protein QF037_005738 [Streptomyces canus]|uniref:hypothetical protein n=1 Tax=Streptomyces canus TaxID=58343 RepID=UPI00278AB25B|nr:hypothetical protein [Streptomyces canus]MDQ0601393.1 hypothetical protein [Streptomyces canus]
MGFSVAVGMGATPGTGVLVAVGMGVESLTEALRSFARRGEDRIPAAGWSASTESSRTSSRRRPSVSRCTVSRRAATGRGLPADGEGTQHRVQDPPVGEQLRHAVCRAHGERGPGTRPEVVVALD